MPPVLSSISEQNQLWLPCHPVPSPISRHYQDIPLWKRNLMHRTIAHELPCCCTICFMLWRWICLLLWSSVIICLLLSSMTICFWCLPWQSVWCLLWQSICSVWCLLWQSACYVWCFPWQLSGVFRDNPFVLSSVFCDNPFVLSGVFRDTIRLFCLVSSVTIVWCLLWQSVCSIYYLPWQSFMSSSEDNLLLSCVAVCCLTLSSSVFFYSLWTLLKTVFCCPLWQSVVLFWALLCSFIMLHLLHGFLSFDRHFRFVDPTFLRGFYFMQFQTQDFVILHLEFEGGC